MEWRPAGWSVYLPLLIFPCTIKSRSSLLAPAHPGGPGKRAVKWLWCGGGANWYCYQAAVEDLFDNTQRPGWVGSWVKNPDPVSSLPGPLKQWATIPFWSRKKRMNPLLTYYLLRAPLVQSTTIKWVDDSWYLTVARHSHRQATNISAVATSVTCTRVDYTVHATLAWVRVVFHKATSKEFLHRHTELYHISTQQQCVFTAYTVSQQNSHL